MEIIKADSIFYSYNDLEVLHSIDFSVKKGEWTSLLGPSGCGKSTLLMILAGLLSPSSGQVFIKKLDCTSRPGEVSFMHQKDLLLPWKTLMENLMVPLLLKKTSMEEAREKVDSCLQRFGLKGFETYYPYQLSGGMRQRASLLRCFLYCQEVILLDEPFGALDAITRMHLQKWLLEFIQEVRSTVVLVTHNIDEAVMLSDNIIVLSKLPGRILKTIGVPLSHPRPGNILMAPEAQSLRAEIAESLKI